MNTIYAERTRQDAEQYRLLQQASEELEGILGASSDSANAQWDLQQDDKGKPVYALTLRDPTGEVTRFFEPDELRRPHWLGFRLHRLWGDLLHIDIQRRIQRLGATED